MTPDELYFANEKLIYQVLKKRYPKSFFDDDLRQVASIGLWRACVTYNEDISKFSTYAYKCIQNELAQYFRSLSAKSRNSSEYTIVSLDKPADFLDSDTASFADLIIGTTDIDYVDFDGFWKSLTSDERMIVTKIINGKTQREIANELMVSQTTVSRHMGKVRKKFDEFI